jgi:hypothetical protein
MMKHETDGPHCGSGSNNSIRGEFREFKSRKDIYGKKDSLFLRLVKVIFMQDKRVWEDVSQKST